MATGSQREQTGAAAFTEIQGIRTRYRQLGGGPDVLVLHGWGANLEAVHPIVSDLGAQTRVLAVDLPGFGQTALPPAPWSVGDYARWTLALLDAFALRSPSIVGHSFGGRIAIHLASNHPDRVARLLLVDAAGIRPKRGPRYYLKVASAKAVKRLGPRLGPLGRGAQQRIARRVASSDYAAAGPLRPTFVRVVNEDLTPLLSSIAAPTLLIWGAEDRSTPLRDGREMERLIPDAALIVFAGAGHFSYLDDRRRFALIARSFLTGPQPDRR